MSHIRFGMRRVAALGLVLALAGTGIASWAVATDNLIVTNQFQVLSADVQGSKDGTTYTQTVAITWTLDGMSIIGAPLYIKNAGNYPANVTFATTATGSPSITGSVFWMRSDVLSCPTVFAVAPGASGTGGGANNLARTTSTAGASLLTGTTQVPASPAWTIAAGTSSFLCLAVGPVVVTTAADTATQVLTFTFTASLPAPV